MKKLRLALNKGEKLRFLSHLDYAQAVERMIRRAEIKMAYSEGFNPHMKISFSSALALGVTAAAEYIDMDRDGNHLLSLPLPLVPTLVSRKLYLQCNPNDPKIMARRNHEYDVQNMQDSNHSQRMLSTKFHS